MEEANPGLKIHGIFYVSIHVADLARAKRFYSELLQWKIETDEPTVAGLRFGEAENARLKRLGVPVTVLTAKPWGERSLGFTDPDGYEWSYGQIDPAQ